MQARERLDEAEAEMLAAEKALSDYIANALGIGGQSSGSSKPTPTPTQRPPSPAKQTLEGFDPKRRHPEAMALKRRIGWPKKADDTTRGRGMLYQPDGYPWNAEPLRSTCNGPAHAMSDLNEPWASEDAYRTTRHIEGHAAALMRKYSQREAVLYLNLAPCGGPDNPDPQRCHENIPKILPEGYKLTIHTVLENGGYRRNVYRGTGEALK